MSLLSQIYGVAVNLKNEFYDRGILDQIQVPCKVISIGNLTAGGTGKTPFADLVLTRFRLQQQKAAVVSRGYKSAVQSPEQVHVNDPQAIRKYGDEPTWIADRHPGIPVFVGAVKSETLAYCYHQCQPQVVVVDDGFQHRALRRDLDIVLIDASAPDWHYQLLPTGRMREGFASLERAGLVILTKIESAGLERIESLRRDIQKYFPGPQIETRQVLSFPGAQESRVFAFSGIAQPQNFKNALASHYREVSFKAFPDHHNYTRSDLEKIVQSAKGHDLILTTEKDAVKLKGTALEHLIKPVVLRVEFEKGESDFYAALDSVLR